MSTYQRNIEAMVERTDYADICGSDRPDWKRKDYKICPVYPRDMMIYQKIGKACLPDDRDFHQIAYPEVTLRPYLTQGLYIPTLTEELRSKLENQIKSLSQDQPLIRRRHNAKHLLEHVFKQYFQLKHFVNQSWNANNLTTGQLEVDCFWIAAACLIATTGGSMNLKSGEWDSAGPLRGKTKTMKWRPLIINNFLYEHVFKKTLPDPPANSSTLFLNVTFPHDLMGLLRIGDLDDNGLTHLEWFHSEHDFLANQVPLFLFQEELCGHNLTEEARKEVLDLCPFCFIAVVQVAFYWSLGIQNHVINKFHPAAKVATKLAVAIVTMGYNIPEGWDSSNLDKTQYIMMVLNVNAKKWLEECLANSEKNN